MKVVGCLISKNKTNTVYDWANSTAVFQVGNDLTLYISLYASSGGRKVLISDCRRIDLSLKIKDSDIFGIKSGKLFNEEFKLCCV